MKKTLKYLFTYDNRWQFSAFEYFTFFILMPFAIGANTNALFDRDNPLYIMNILFLLFISSAIGYLVGRSVQAERMLKIAEKELQPSDFIPPK